MAYEDIFDEIISEKGWENLGELVIPYDNRLYPELLYFDEKIFNVKIEDRKLKDIVDELIENLGLKPTPARRQVMLNQILFSQRKEFAKLKKRLEETLAVSFDDIFNLKMRKKILSNKLPVYEIQVPKHPLAKPGAHFNLALMERLMERGERNFFILLNNQGYFANEQIAKIINEVKAKPYLKNLVSWLERTKEFKGDPLIRFAGLTDDISLNKAISDIFETTKTAQALNKEIEENLSPEFKAQYIAGKEGIGRVGGIVPAREEKARLPVKVEEIVETSGRIEEGIEKGVLPEGRILLRLKSFMKNNWKRMMLSGLLGSGGIYALVKFLGKKEEKQEGEAEETLPFEIPGFHMTIEDYLKHLNSAYLGARSAFLKKIEDLKNFESAMYLTYELLRREKLPQLSQSEIMAIELYSILNDLDEKDKISFYKGYMNAKRLGKRIDNLGEAWAYAGEEIEDSQEKMIMEFIKSARQDPSLKFLQAEVMRAYALYSYVLKNYIKSYYFTKNALSENENAGEIISRIQEEIRKRKGKEEGGK